MDKQPSSRVAMTHEQTPVLNTEQAARYASLSPSTLAKLRMRGGNVPHIKIGRRCLSLMGLLLLPATRDVEGTFDLKNIHIPKRIDAVKFRQANNGSVRIGAIAVNLLADIVVEPPDFEEIG